MSLPKITVISTGCAAKSAHVCRSSVASQVGVDAEHVYIEVSEQSPRKTKLENVHDAIAKLPPERVVVILDGDDWLAHRRALARVAEAHAGGMLVTYGSFATTDGRRGFAAPYEPNEDYRSSPWRLTHLKTFRAGLFQRIRPADLRMPRDVLVRAPLSDDGLQALGTPSDHTAPSTWIHVADDMAFMYPVVEQAGRDRTLFIRDILCVYAEDTSWEATATPLDLAHQRQVVAHIRSGKPYARLSNP